MHFDATSHTLHLPTDCSLNAAGRLVVELENALSRHSPKIISGQAVTKLDSATVSLLLSAARLSKAPITFSDMPDSFWKLAKLYDVAPFLAGKY